MSQIVKFCIRMYTEVTNVRYTCRYNIIECIDSIHVHVFFCHCTCRCFSKASVEDILAALEAEGTDWANKVLEVCLHCVYMYSGTFLEGHS